MSTYDITLLQSSLVPVASGTAVSLYDNPTMAMSPAQITSYTDSNSPTLTATTDSAGHFQATLNSGDNYLVVPSGYDGVYIAPSTTTAIFATVLVPTTLCTVSGIITASDGSPQAGVTVTASLNASGPIEGQNVILASAPSTTTNSNGAWSLALIPNVLIDPKNTLYTFVFTQPADVVPAYPFFSFGAPVKPHGPSVAYTVQVPNSPTAEFSDLAS